MLHCLNDLSNDCIQPFSWLLGVHLYLPCIGRANRLWVGSEALVLLATPSCGSVRATMARSAMVLRTTLVRSTSFLEKTRSAEGRTVVLRTPYRSPGEEGARTVCPLGSLPHAAPWPPWRPTPPPDRCVLRRGQPPPGRSYGPPLCLHTRRWAAPCGRHRVSLSFHSRATPPRRSTTLRIVDNDI